MMLNHIDNNMVDDFEKYSHDSMEFVFDDDNNNDFVVVVYENMIIIFVYI